MRFLHRVVAATDTPTAETGGLAGRPPVTVPGMPGVHLAGDWVGPDGLLADAALASRRRRRSGGGGHPGGGGGLMTATAADEFEEHRRHLFAVAYRMLGSVRDAEDVVQDAWLRWRAGDPRTSALAGAPS